MNTKDTLNSAFFILLGCWILYLAKDMKAEFYTIGAGFFPAMLSIFLIAVNLPRLIMALSADSVKDSSEKSDRRVFFCMFIMVIYILCTYLFGTVLSSILLMYYLMHYLGNRSQLQKIIMALVVPFAVKAIFKWLLVLPLPRGLLDLI